MSDIILHSGSFIDRDDNGIRVTFYKKNLYITPLIPEYREININSGQAVNLTEYMEFMGTLRYVDNSWVSSLSGYSLYTNRNYNDTVARFRVEFYLEEDPDIRHTLYFNMLPEDTYIGNAPDVMTFDGHQMLMPLILSTDTDYVTTPTGIDLAHRNWLHNMENYPDPTVIIPKTEGGGIWTFYPDIETRIGIGEENRVFYYLSVCKYPNSQGPVPVVYEEGKINFDFYNPSIGDRNEPIRLGNLTTLNDACVAFLGRQGDEHFIFDASRDGEEESIEIYTGYGRTSGLQAAGASDYFLDFIDLGYGDDWVDLTTAGDGYIISVPANNTGLSRSIGIRVTHRDNANNWAELLVRQKAKNTLYTNVDELNFTSDGGSRVFEVWSTTGDAIVYDEELPAWIEMRLAGTDPVEGTDFYKYQYVVIVPPVSGSISGRTATFSCGIEGVSRQEISKDIIIRQTVA